MNKHKCSSGTKLSVTNQVRGDSLGRVPGDSLDRVKRIFSKRHLLWISLLVFNHAYAQLSFFDSGSTTAVARPAPSALSADAFKNLVTQQNQQTQAAINQQLSNQTSKNPPLPPPTVATQAPPPPLAVTPAINAPKVQPPAPPPVVAPVVSPPPVVAPPSPPMNSPPPAPSPSIDQFSTLAPPAPMNNQANGGNQYYSGFQGVSPNSPPASGNNNSSGFDIKY